MKNYYDVPTPNQTGIRTKLYLLTVALMLGLGLALASSAHGAGLAQTGGGKITGSVTVGNVSAQGIAVELRQRTNAGADTILSTATTDSNGIYAFSGQPSAPGDAFYYVRFTGGKGTLASWYTWPIIYLTGSDFSVPAVDLSDVQLVEPTSGATIAPGGAIKWKARRAGETYRLFIYTEGKNDKPAVDSGSLGSNTEYSLSGGLAEGNYEGVVQIRDAVLGYGQSAAHFRFTVGKAKIAGNPTPQGSIQQGVPAAEPTTVPSSPIPPIQPAETGGADQPQPTVVPPTVVPPTAVPPTAVPPTAVPPTVEPTTSSPPVNAPPTSRNADVAKPDLKLHLSADKLSVGQGNQLVYTIEVHNDGDGAAPNVVVTDQLPAGVSINSSQSTSTQGSVAVSGNTVTVQVGDLAPNATANVQIPVNVNGTAVNNLSNQASAVYNEAPEAVQSNAFISQVAEPLAGPPAAPPQQPANSQPQQPASQPPANPPAAPQDSQQAASPQAPSADKPASQPQQPAASQPQSPPKAPVTVPATKPAQSPQTKAPAAPMPQTGGSFPLVLAALLLAMALLARYLRGVRFRRS